MDGDLTCVNIVKLERTGSLFASDISALIIPSGKTGVDKERAVLHSKDFEYTNTSNDYAPKSCRF